MCPFSPNGDDSPWNSTVSMIQAGFLDPELLCDLIELARDGSVPQLLGRRANALVLLDQGMNCSAVAKVLFRTTTRSAPGIDCISKTASMVW